MISHHAALTALAACYARLYGRAASVGLTVKGPADEAVRDERTPLALDGARLLGGLWIIDPRFAVALWLDSQPGLKARYGDDWPEYLALVTLDRAERYAGLSTAARRGAGLWWPKLPETGRVLLVDACAAWERAESNPNAVPLVLETASRWRSELADDQIKADLAREEVRRRRKAEREKRKSTRPARKSAKSATST